MFVGVRQIACGSLNKIGVRKSSERMRWKSLFKFGSVSASASAQVHVHTRVHVHVHSPMYVYGSACTNDEFMD